MLVGPRESQTLLTNGPSSSSGPKGGMKKKKKAKGQKQVDQVVKEKIPTKGWCQEDDKQGKMFNIAV
ncbi:hypothetical protein ACS0TY_022317 [Phlomoides rotata]